MTWPKTDDGLWYIFDGEIKIPVEPSTGAPILLLRPSGGVGQAIPAVDAGAPGKHAELSTTINFTELAYDDPTPAGASFTTITPPTDSVAGVYRLNLTLHEGAPGASGTTTIVPSTYGTAIARKILIVDPANTAQFILASQRVGGRHYPVSIANAASGDTNKTLATVAIPAGTYDFDYRVEVEAQTIVTGTGANVSVDLVARLNDETGGNDIGRGFGIGGTKDRLIIAGGAAANPADGWDRVTAGSGCTVYVRTEKQSGSDNYTTSSATTRVKVTVLPIV